MALDSFGARTFASLTFASLFDVKYQIVIPVALTLRSKFTTVAYLRSHPTVSFDMASLPTDSVNIKSKIK